ncbi:MAG TPA: TetR/AcrR family transcriptional regulator, partial [Acidimicrobiales bacterium]|nr:TetR/AcrR family transcriptional regulator [Acidimicrobiales bacterium]
MKEPIDTNEDLRQQRGEERYFGVHESILEATIELLDSRVFTEVTIPLIADHADCSVPSIYNHFPGAVPEIFEEVSMRIRNEGFHVNQEKIDQASGLQILEELLNKVDEVRGFVKVEPFVEPEISFRIREDIDIS